MTSTGSSSARLGARSPGVPSRPPRPPRGTPSAWRGRVLWSLLLAASLLVGDFFALEAGSRLVCPASGVALAWLASRRTGRALGADGALLLLVTGAVARATGSSWPEAAGSASSLLVQTTVAVVVLAWVAPALWSGHRLEKLRVGDLWWLVSAAALGAVTGHAVGRLWTMDAGGWWDVVLLVDSAASLLGMLLVGTAALVLHHQVLGRRAGTTVAGQLLGALGYRQPSRYWWLESVLLYVVSTLLYVLVFTLPYGLSYAFSLVLVAVFIGLRHPPLYKAVHGATQLAVVAFVVDPTRRTWFGLPADDSGAAIVQLLLFAVISSGLTISILTEERRSWASRLVKAERRTRDQMSLVRGVLDRLEDGVAVYAEAHDAPIYQNAASEQLLGGTDGDVGLTLTRPDGRLLPEEDMPAARVLAGEQISGEEYVLRSTGAPEGRAVLVSGIPWEGDWPEGPRRAIVVAHDVTALRRQRDELEAFVGTVAHDLRNPVTVIEGWAEEIRDDPAVTALRSPLLDSGLQRISSVAERMQQLISGLLAWSTAQGRMVSPQPVDLAEMVRDVCHSHREASPADRVPRFDVGLLPTVHGDPLLLRQVFDNLVGNAVKYVSPGVVPHVRVLAGPPDGDWVTLAVADNGIGIPPDLQADIFQGFFRVSDQRFAGTGLGLRICRTIVERHGGTIAVEGQPGGSGTIFSVTLPTTAEVAERAVEAYTLDHLS